MGHLYICFDCLLSICVFVSNNFKSAEPIEPNFVWDLAWPQGRFTDAQNYKNMYLKASDFCENLKMRKQIFKNPQTFFVIFYIVQREDAHR